MVFLLVGFGALLLYIAHRTKSERVEVMCEVGMCTLLAVAFMLATWEIK